MVERFCTAKCLADHSVNYAQRFFQCFRLLLKSIRVYRRERETAENSEKETSVLNAISHPVNLSLPVHPW